MVENPHEIQNYFHSFKVDMNYLKRDLNLVSGFIEEEKDHSCKILMLINPTFLESCDEVNCVNGEFMFYAIHLFMIKTGDFKSDPNLDFFQTLKKLIIWQSIKNSPNLKCSVDKFMDYFNSHLCLQIDSSHIIEQLSCYDILLDFSGIYMIII